MKRIVVTGANKGIGRAIVEAILEQDAEAAVELGSRDAQRGEATRAAIVEAHPQWASRIDVLPLDVSDDASVTAAAAAVGERRGETPLYGVVNNAGIGLGAFDLDAVLQVNTLGIRRVCEAFIPQLADGGRIVNVTSASGPMFVSRCSEARQRFFVDTTATWGQLHALLDECRGFSDAAAFEAAGLANGEAYGLSKAAANLYTLILAREHARLRINACTPGFIETDLTRPYAESSGRSPQEMGMKPPSAGARAPVFLLLGEPDGTGHYYGSDAVRSPLDRYRSPGDPPYTGD